MEKPKKFTARNAAKYAVKATVHLNTSQLTKSLITDYTSFDDTDNSVKIAAYLVGWYVSDVVKPVTDVAVDKTFDFVAAKREARKAKKNTEETK